MTDHPITPPPELVQQWQADWYHAKVKHIELEDHIATKAARWGADHELEACCKWQADHPITPPPELVQQWQADWYHAKVKHIELEDHIATKAARWGADHELEACCKWLECNYNYPQANPLRAARRPKPPSLKEQALEALGRFSANAHTTAHQMQNDFDLFRRALEALDD